MDERDHLDRLIISRRSHPPKKDTAQFATVPRKYIDINQSGCCARVPVPFTGLWEKLWKTIKWDRI